jgi:DNA-binding transcriptional LysR family regulator
MELRHLRYFIAVAESRSFRVASERIHVTQPAITRQIRDLETEIGVTLFQRTSVGVVLTPAGELFLRETHTVFSLLGAATRSARRVAAGLEGGLRIGFIENSSWDGLVPDAFARYQSESPGIHLELLPMNSPEQIESLVAGHIDGAFVYMLDPLPAGILSIPLGRRGVLLAVPRQWGWPHDHAVCVNQLNGKPIVAFPRHTYPAYYDYLLEACNLAGLTLDVVQEVSTEAAILSLVSAGIGAAIVNDGNRSRPLARVQFLEFADLPLSIPLAFAYREGNPDPALAHFIAMLKSLLDEAAAG